MAKLQSRPPEANEMDVHALAADFGFAECYVFTTEPFVAYERRLQDGALHSDAKGVRFDIAQIAPWANAILALVYPYRPYANEIPVSGYYPSSNAAYHVAGKLIRRLEESGVRAVRAEVPVAELLSRNGYGTLLKSGLTWLPGYGTRFYVTTLAAELTNPEYAPLRAPQPARCATCHACERACPSGAIDQSGYAYQKCARAYMCGGPMDRWVMDAMDCMLGCERCQTVCPYNVGIEPITQLPDAFRLEELLGGRVKPALEIVGKNLNKQGRLIQHACVVAGNQRRTDLIPLIESWRDDPREAVRSAADYALELLRMQAE
ncbi:MAG: 4Fe-4S dicluster domain-containing protein [Clostridiales bacterium]|nr:4Fe-4S dicluster domain-containing protein [Clostridiales bacterium]